MPRDELPAVVAGREHDSAPPHSRMLPDLELDAVAQGSEAARLDDARRTRMEMPSSIPRCGLKVFSARATPSGTEIVTAIFPEKPCAAHTSRTAEVIIARGVALMAAAPPAAQARATSRAPRPRRHRRKLPIRARARPCCPQRPCPAPHVPRARTRARRRSHRHRRLRPFARRTGRTLADAYVDHVRLDGQPAGVTIDTRPTVFRDKSISQAAFAARAAQLPVV